MEKNFVASTVLNWGTKEIPVRVHTTNSGFGLTFSGETDENGNDVFAAQLDRFRAPIGNRDALNVILDHVTLNGEKPELVDSKTVGRKKVQLVEYVDATDSSDPIKIVMTWNDDESGTWKTPLFAVTRPSGGTRGRAAKQASTADDLLASM